MIGFNPLGNRILVKKIEEENKTQSGIILTNDKEKPFVAEVVNISEELNTPIQIGNKVLHTKFAGTNIEVDGKEYILLNITDILGIYR